MKKLLVGLALISFVFVTTVGVNAATALVDKAVIKTKANRLVANIERMVEILKEIWLIVKCK